MAEIREIRDAMRRKKRNRNILKITTVIILLVLVVTIFINRDNLTPEAISHWLSGAVAGEGEGEGFPVNLPSGETVSLSAAANNIALTNQTNIYFYTQRGKQIRNVQHSLKSVQSKTGGGNVLLYSVGDKGVRVETYTKTAVNFKTDNNVTMGEIAKNGRFVLATESDVYTSEMIVYDKNANAIFKWSPSGAVISSVGISGDGHHICAATLYTQGGKIVSEIYLFSTAKGEALFSYKIEDEIVLSLSCSSSEVRVVTDQQAVTINKNSEQKGAYKFDEKSVIDIVKKDDDTFIVFKDVNDPGKSVLVVLDSKSNLVAQAQIEDKINKISTASNKVYLLSEEHLYTHEAATALSVKKSKIDSEAQNLCATSSGAFVITSALQLIKL